jgi:hypothetical protein
MPTRDQLTRAYQNAVERLRADTVRATQDLWRALPDYRDADIARFRRTVIPVVRSASQRVAQLTAAYQMRSLEELGDRVPMALVPASEIAEPRGVDAQTVYQRPAVTVYTELSQGAPLALAVAAGARRLQSLVETDLQLVKVAQSRQSIAASSFEFYRRVLTGNENCALCVIASTQRYHKRALMPIHPGCDCSVEVLAVDQDPGQVIDPALLEGTHGKVAELTGVADRGGRAPDYRELIVTSEHGEIGPYLRWRADAFTGPADI